MAKKVTEIRLEFPDDATRSAFETAFQSWLRTYQKSSGRTPEAAEGDIHRIGYQKPAGEATGASPELIYVDFIPGF